MLRVWRWLLPGLGLKRWLAAGVAGVLLIGGGLSFLLEAGHVLSRIHTAWHGGPTSPILHPWVAGILVTGIGVALALGSMLRLVKSVLETLNPGENRLAEKFYQRRQLLLGPRVVALGGGTGLPAVLRGMKEYTANICAIVTVSDDGGSSGRLRVEFGILPPGDIRNCLVALADSEPVMERLFQYRFRQGEGLSGHTFGNLFILAMSEITGDFYRAVRESSQVLAVRGRVIPSTLDQVTLRAELTDGQVVEGESAIGAAPAPIRRLHLQPVGARAVEDAVQQIEEADVVVLGPGSLYTSVIPNLLVPEIAAALRRTKALKVYVSNIMTQPGETTRYTASQHIQAIIEQAGAGMVDCVLVNTGAIPEAQVRRYAERGAHVVEADMAEIACLGLEVVTADLVDVHGDLVRHHAARLAAKVAELTLDRPARTDRIPWELLWLRQRLLEKSQGVRKTSQGGL